jgi:DNA-binding ferritin-like protein
MTKTIEADSILRAAEPLVHQHAPDPAVRAHRQNADRPIRERVQGQCRKPQSAARGHDDAAGFVQETPLAARWTDLLPLHLLFDKHYSEQNELVDAIAERIQVLGGVSVAMAPDVAEMTLIPRPPKGREEVPVQISRLLHAHEIVLKEARTMARLAANSGDDGSNDLIVSDVIRRNELQAWFVAEHVVSGPLTHAR